MKKIVSLLLVLCMIFSLGAFNMTAFAATSDQYLIGINCDYVVKGIPGQTLTFYAGAAHYAPYGLEYTGFDTAVDAMKYVCWGVDNGSENVDYVMETYAQFNSTYASKVEVTLEDYAEPGVIVVRATKTTEECTCGGGDCSNCGCCNVDDPNVNVRFVIIIEPDATDAYTVSGVKVEVFDYHGSSFYTYSDVGYTVDYAANNSSYTFYNIQRSAQYYPTPANVLDNMINDSYTSVSAVIPMTSAVNTITIQEGSNPPVNYAPIYNSALHEWTGWHYRVYHAAGIDPVTQKTIYEVVPLSQYISATAYMLEDDDVVVWVYASESEAEALFEVYTPTI